MPYYRIFHSTLSRTLQYHPQITIFERSNTSCVHLHSSKWTNKTHRILSDFPHFRFIYSHPLSNGNADALFLFLRDVLLPLYSLSMLMWWKLPIESELPIIPAYPHHYLFHPFPFQLAWFVVPSIPYARKACFGLIERDEHSIISTQWNAHKTVDIHQYYYHFILLGQWL